MKAVCYAAGIIGSSWATTFALNGCDVSIFDLEERFLDNAKAQVKKNLEYLSECGCLAAEESKKILERCTFTTKIKDALEDADFIQESGPEKLEIKQEIVKILDTYSPRDCVIASSTSGLKISDITKYSEYPQRYIGAHPFNPPHLIPLVEITRGEKTEDVYLEKAVCFYQQMKKEPIILKKEKTGYVANRLSHAVLREVMNLVAEGVCSVEEVDKALVYGLGLRWGSIGQMMIGELGTPGGTRACVERFGSLNEMIFKDLEERKTLPENWAEIAAEGVAEEKSNMPDFIGHTNAEIGEFRDKVLIELLKLHHKI